MPRDCPVFCIRGWKDALIAALPPNKREMNPCMFTPYAASLAFGALRP
jgi:hypothetical protein